MRFLLRHPLTGFRSRPARVEIQPRLMELCRPTWSWRYRTWRGNTESILRANRQSFLEAREAWGSIDLIHAQVSFPAGYLADRLGEEMGVPRVISEHMSDFPFPQFTQGGQVVEEVAAPLRKARRVTAVEELLRAIAALRPSREVRFQIAGVGTQEGAYRGLADRLGIAGQVEWLGLLDRVRVRDALRGCDAFVLTSRHESFGVVYAEALACGKPVIATRSGGPEDIVTDANGLLVPVGDVDAIARALGTMIERARDYDAGAIRADFERRFASQVVSRRYAELYAEAVGS
jgi:hypothetical protein